MIIGEITERLISLKDNHDDLHASEYEAIIEACNLLNKLPRMEEARNYEPVKDRVV